MIEFNHLAKTYYEGFFRKAVRAVRDVNFKVESGSIFGYLGPNGSGKSTTLKLLMGLIYPTNGNVTIMGRESFHPDARSEIGFLPELPYFYEYLTGWETLEFHGRLAGLSKGQSRKNSKMLLEVIKLDSTWLDKKVKNYSKGMAQKLGLVQSVLHFPKWVVWDEPMSGLDPLGRMEVQNLLRALHQNGSTIFYSSHVLSDVESVCSHIAIIHKGIIKTSGRLSDVMVSREDSYKIRLSHGPDSLPQNLTGQWNASLYTYSCASEEEKNMFMDWALKNNLNILSLSKEQNSLEQLFSYLVGEGHA